MSETQGEMAGHQHFENLGAGTRDLLNRLDEILDEAGIYLATEVRNGVLSLSGEVASEESRDAALDIATAMAAPRELTIDHDIAVTPTAPHAFDDGQTAAGERFGYVNPDMHADGVLDPGMEAEPDFTDDSGTTDSEESAAEATPYFPPTDPVTRTRDRGREGLEVLGGFSSTSMDDLEGAAGFDARDDDDVSLSVLRELREDALTTDLVVHVKTRNGVVTLRGEVETIEDAENAEAVASRVDGVREVREQLKVTSMRRPNQAGT